MTIRMDPVKQNQRRKQISMRTAKTSLLISFLAGGMFLSVSGKSLAVEVPANSVRTKGLNVLIIGHSLTHGLRALEPLAAMVGHSDHHQTLYTILGAGIAYHYQMETNRWAPKSWRELYLRPDKKWDALIMSARDVGSDEEYAPKFAAEAFKGNPQCQVFIYGNWPTPQESFDKPSLGRTEAHIERVGAAVDKAFPHAPKTRMMPCSLVIRELGRLAERGELPAVASHFELFSDGDHPSKVAAYAINVLVMSMLYNESPLAYPADIHAVDQQGKAIRGDVFKDLHIPEATATVVKRVVWDVLQTYPPAGMPFSLVIANRHMEPVIAGQPYKAELKPLNAAGPCVWSIIKGTLPAGLSLSPDGLLAGQSVAVGDYPLVIQLADGKNSFERPLVVTVNRDTPPSIPDQPLKTVSMDQYVMQPLQVTGGVGHTTWSLGGGKLPYGIMLSPAGMLVGNPGEAGEFTFAIKAQDSYPTGPRAAEKQFTWKIGPAAPDTLPVKYVVTEGTDITHLPDIHADKDIKKFMIPAGSVIKIDGKLSEPFWKLDQPIEKKVKGTPTKKAAFSCVWTAVSDGNGDPKQILPGKVYVGETPGRAWKLTGRDLVLAIKVLDGPKGKTPKDGVHIFIDGNHDRTRIYSSDDSHFFVPRNHKGGSAQPLRGKVNWFSEARVQEIEGGYTMEIRLGGNNYFGGEGNWIPFGVKGVYGFDLAVDEGDDKEVSQQVWRGDANDAEDTSHFGTIVLTGRPAAASPEHETK